MEVVLKSYLLMASSLHSALSITKAISLANSLIKGTKYEQTFIAWKKQCGLPYQGVQLVGCAWWNGFKKWNADIDTKAGRKFEQNRHDHCTYPAFSKMYD